MKRFLKDNANYSPSLGHNLRGRRIVVDPKIATTTSPTRCNTNITATTGYISTPLSQSNISIVQSSDEATQN